MEDRDVCERSFADELKRPTAHPDTSLSEVKPRGDQRQAADRPERSDSRCGGDPSVAPDQARGRAGRPPTRTSGSRARRRRHTWTALAPYSWISVKERSSTSSQVAARQATRTVLSASTENDRADRGVDDDADRECRVLLDRPLFGHRHGPIENVWIDRTIPVNAEQRRRAEDEFADRGCELDRDASEDRGSIEHSQIERRDDACSVADRQAVGILGPPLGGRRGRRGIRRREHRRIERPRRMHALGTLETTRPVNASMPVAVAVEVRMSFAAPMPTAAETCDRIALSISGVRRPRMTDATR
jgi:hypothetical protein